MLQTKTETTTAMGAVGVAEGEKTPVPPVTAAAPDPSEKPSPDAATAPDSSEKPSPDAAPLLEVRGLRCGYGDRCVVRGVSFSLSAGQEISILGPNGVGKTTLFKTLLGFLPAQGGTVTLDGRDALQLSRRQFAQLVAYIPQEHTPAFPFSVQEFVLMGRTPELRSFESPSAADERIAREALEQLGIECLAERDYTSLSGGERQMVLVARALAQRPRLLVMDEPCASLDLGNQMLLIGQLKKLAADGMAVIMTTHEPNHAFALGGRALCMGRGGSLACGPVEELLTPQLLSELYGIDVEVVPVHARNGSSACGCIPLLSTSEPQRA